MQSDSVAVLIHYVAVVERLPAATRRPDADVVRGVADARLRRMSLA